MVETALPGTPKRERNAIVGRRQQNEQREANEEKENNDPRPTLPFIIQPTPTLVFRYVIQIG